MARMIDIGFWREAPPPAPMVMPPSSPGAPSCPPRARRRRHPPTGACRSSGDVRVALGDERIPVLVGHTGQAQLEREALLVAVAAPHVPEVDAVKRLLRCTDPRGRLRRDLAGHLERGRAQLVAR